MIQSAGLFGFTGLLAVLQTLNNGDGPLDALVVDLVREREVVLAEIKRYLAAPWR